MLIKIDGKGDTIFFKENYAEIWTLRLDSSAVFSRSVTLIIYKIFWVQPLGLLTVHALRGNVSARWEPMSQRLRLMRGRLAEVSSATSETGNRAGAMSLLEGTFSNTVNSAR